jgi:hypothetical protein
MMFYSYIWQDIVDAARPYYLERNPRRLSTSKRERQPFKEWGDQFLVVQDQKSLALVFVKLNAYRVAVLLSEVKQFIP